MIIKVGFKAPPFGVVGYTAAVTYHFTEPLSLVKEHLFGGPGQPIRQLSFSRHLSKLEAFQITQYIGPG